jgi:hypothetical protein
VVETHDRAFVTQEKRARDHAKKPSHVEISCELDGFA